MDSSLYKIATWIMRLAYVNILWLALTLTGAIIVGFFPATTSMFAVVRQWVIGNTDTSIFNTMWKTYKSEFLKSNILGLVLIFIGIVLYVDFLFFNVIATQFSNVFMFMFFTLLLVYFMLISFIFPVIVHFDMKTLAYLKYALIFGASYPLNTFYITLTITLIVFGSISFPVVAFFFSGSLLSLITMRFAFTAFQKNEEKRRFLSSSNND